jgi:hypothetical protein
MAASPPNLSVNPNPLFEADSGAVGGSPAHADTTDTRVPLLLRRSHRSNKGVPPPPYDPAACNKHATGLPKRQAHVSFAEPLGFRAVGGSGG